MLRRDRLESKRSLFFLQRNFQTLPEDQFEGMLVSSRKPLTTGLPGVQWKDCD